ncbi:hypothetical protein MKW98_030241 [Papaver atlanticum]|uniref:Uncharacterized protein n=1 Tax=Papaver atlanticum TaxID=357466 RepID=A0AAD4SZD1_9MAGN|nr:hypothetical protein MKW98_030241 [Papaver atlanticum]
MIKKDSGPEVIGGVTGIGAEAGHVIATAVGCRNSQPKQYTGNFGLQPCSSGDFLGAVLFCKGDCKGKALGSTLNGWGCSNYLHKTLALSFDD